MRNEKQLLLDEIKDQIDQFKSFVIMNYQGLGPNVAGSFRREVSASGGNYEVVRKRILIKAAQKAGIDLDIKDLPGHIGVVFSGTDPIQTTKMVFKFKKDTDNLVSVVGGRIDGQLYNAEEMDKLSLLPGKDEMRAQFLSVLEAPMSTTVRVMDAQLTSVLHCIENKCKQEGN